MYSMSRVGQEGLVFECTCPPPPIDSGLVITLRRACAAMLLVANRQARQGATLCVSKIQSFFHQVCDISPN